jgi:hypothetical protein
MTDGDAAATALPAASGALAAAQQPTATTADNKTTMESLVWRVAETKAMFQKYRLWPSFVGLCLDQDKKARKGKLPVCLWDEQRRYLCELGAREGLPPSSSAALRAAVTESTSSSSSRSTGKKRKLGERDDGDDDGSSTAPGSEGEDGPPLLKRPRTTLLGQVVDGLQSLWTSAVSWASTWLGGAAIKAPADAAAAAAAAAAAGSRKKRRDGDVQMAVFRELQQRQYFVGPGDVYGGDYTIYRGGDPSNAHSTATVRVVRQRTITARDLISFSRVQNQVAKSAVLAYLDPKSKEPKFVVVNFQSVSDRA